MLFLTIIYKFLMNQGAWVLNTMFMILEYNLFLLEGHNLPELKGWKSLKCIDV